MNWIEGITLFGVLITLCVAAGNWITTSRNLKTSKYIETITSERIKWLSIVRNEVSELLGNIQFALYEMQRDIYGFEPHNIVRGTDKQTLEKIKCEEAESADINMVVESYKIKWSKTDYKVRLYRLMLLFNPNEDLRIIDSINSLIEFFDYSKIHREHIWEAQNNILIIITETQSLLKKEWEKVKKESLGKRDKHK